MTPNNPQSPQSTKEDKGEKLYRWIKASERTPDNDNSVYIKFSEFKDVAYYDGDKWLHESNDKELHKAFLHDMEWLEAYTTHQSTTVGVSAEEILLKYFSNYSLQFMSKELILKAMEEYATQNKNVGVEVLSEEELNKLAIEKYPVKIVGILTPTDVNLGLRVGFVNGYKKAIGL